MSQNNHDNREQLKEKILNNPASKIRIAIKNAEKVVKLTEDRETKNKNDNQIRLLYF